MMLVKNSLTGSLLCWYQIFLSKDISYDHFRCRFLEFYWDHSKQALLRERINHGKFEPKSKRDMADYLIELAQLSRLLNPPLKDDEFLNLAIQHFPQEVRSALIVAKPTDFGETVSLLKKLQCRKLNERNGEVNLGIYHPGRQSPQGSEGHSVVGREAGASKATGTSPEVYGEQANCSRKHNVNEWENRAGPSGEGGNRWKNNENRGRAQRNYQGNFVDRNEGSYNRQRSGHPYRNNNFRNGGVPARINFFLAEYNNSNWNGRSRPYWLSRNVSNGYYRPRNNGIEIEETSAEARTGDGRTGEATAEVKVTLQILRALSLNREMKTETEGKTKRPVTQPG